MAVPCPFLPGEGVGDGRWAKQHERQLCRAIFSEIDILFSLGMSASVTAAAPARTSFVDNGVSSFPSPAAYRRGHLSCSFSSEISYLKYRGGRWRAASQRHGGKGEGRKEGRKIGGSGRFFFLLRYMADDNAPRWCCWCRTTTLPSPCYYAAAVLC